jgi:hypothetical protein
VRVSEVFPYAVDKRFLAIWSPFGIRPSKDAVILTDDGRFVATYGFSRLETSLDNVTGAHVTRGYRWWKAIGVRGSFEDDGLTFGTNIEGGVCIHFRNRVKGPLRRSWSALTVTVADLDGLVAALNRTTGSALAADA